MDATGAMTGAMTGSTTDGGAGSATMGAGVTGTTGWIGGDVAPVDVPAGVGLTWVVMGVGAAGLGVVGVG